jgi:hypothetical protein
MQACYSQCELIANAMLRLFAASLGLQQHYFDNKVCRHHSNLQVRKEWCLAAAAALAHLIACYEPTLPEYFASLGLQQHYFDNKVCRHHSNLQVNQGVVQHAHLLPYVYSPTVALDSRQLFFKPPHLVQLQIAVASHNVVRQYQVWIARYCSGASC